MPSALFPLFLSRAVEAMRGFASALPTEVKGRIARGDTRSESAPGEFYDIVTSPPYIDSIDYVYNQMLEYFWLLPELGLGSYHDLRALRKTPLGFNTSLDPAGDLIEQHVGSASAKLRDLCLNIAATSPKEAVVVANYFVDFARHLINIKKDQPKGGYYVCIIGNTTVRDFVIPTADLLTRVFEHSNYLLLDRVKYEIRRHYMKFPRRANSGKIREDHILTFIKQ